MAEGQPDLKWQRYIAWYLCVVILLLTIVAVFNALVDPNGRFLWLDRAGFNQAKVTVPTNTRIGKANALRQCGYTHLILGSSRAESGIPVSYPGFPPGRTYNAALKAVSMYEMRRVVEYALQWHVPEVVVLSLDFYAFSERNTTADDFDESPFAEALQLGPVSRYLLSIDSLRDSVRTVRRNWQGSFDSCLDNGEHKPRYEPDPARITFDFILGRYAVGQYKRYSQSEWHYDNFSQLLRELRGAGVTVYAAISPIHAIQQELLAEMGLRTHYESWKRRLVKIIDDVNAESSNEGPIIALWDFSGFNRITIEAVPEADGDAGFMIGYSDPSHFTKPVGILMLDRMLEGDADAREADDSFGVRLTAEIIDEVLAREAEAALQYRLDNPAEIQRLRAMLESLPN